MKNKQFLQDVLNSLGLEQKELPSMYFYDALGCEIYEQIKWLDEYYLPRTEHLILNSIISELNATLPPIKRVIEYGGGSGLRTETLVKSLHQLTEYIPIDVAQEQLEASAVSINNIRADLTVTGLLGDFSNLPTLPARPAIERLGFLPGSTIGNFNFSFAQDFLTRIHQQLGKGSHLLIGYDLIKETDILLAAYDDAQGVTARFNLNLLTRINRELGANFDVQSFKHESRYNAEKNRIEMHLVSLKEQEVVLAKQQFLFRKNESIHTENSHKYSPEQFSRLLEGTGWSELKTWTDDANYYALSVLSG